MFQWFSALLNGASKLFLSLLIAGSANADIFTYTYTGPDFDTYYDNSQGGSPSPGCCVLGYANISANVTLLQPIGPNAYLLDFYGINILGADALVQWGINGATNQGELELESDANGTISSWYLATYLTPPSIDTPEDQVTLFETTPGYDEIFQANDAGSRTGLVSDAVGTWAASITPTPEPTARPGFKAGMLLITSAFIIFRRKKMAPS